MQQTTDSHGDSEQPCPRLRPEVPLIWRSSDRVHFGDDPVPMTMNASEASWLTSLDSFRTWPRARRACPTGEVRAEHIVARARAARALEDPSECWWLSPAQRCAVRPQLLGLLAWHPQPDQALASRSAHGIGVRGSVEVASAITEALDECQLRVVEPRYADVLVIASVGHIDAIDAHDEDATSTHLPIRFHHSKAAVGPLVVPGQTPCCRCLALHLRDRDAAWPAISTQWRSHAQAQEEAATQPGLDSIDPLLIRRGAIEAVTMVREWIDTPDSAVGERVQLQLPRMTPQRESLAAHDGCGCLWQRQPRSA